MARRDSVDQIVADLRVGLLRATRSRFPFLRQDEVEDSVQETLMRVTQKLKKDRSQIEHPFAFAKKVAFNLVLDEIRRRQCQTLVALPDSLCDTMVSREQDPEIRFTIQQAHDALFECLDRLSEARRIALFLKLKGHKATEIGAQLNWSKRRVENLIFRGRADLVSCMQEKGFRGVPR